MKMRYEFLRFMCARCICSSTAAVERWYSDVEMVRSWNARLVLLLFHAHWSHHPLALFELKMKGLRLRNRSHHGRG